MNHANKPWNLLLPYYQQLYPWESKAPCCVARGANGKEGSHTQQRPDLLDAHLTKLLRTGSEDFDESQFLGDRIPMPDFQKYPGILDVDGHSWSSRYGELLCYSSVVLKVEPSHVDFFQTELQPWVHYIPVRADLSDLYNMVEFVISDEHEEQVQHIINNANAWCIRRLNPESLIHDLAMVMVMLHPPGQLYGRR